MTNSKTAATAALALAGGLVTPLHAQNPGEVIPVSTAQGMLTGHPVGVQLSDIAIPSQTPLVRIRTNGVGSGQFRVWSEGEFGAESINHPDYSPEALFRHWLPVIYGMDPTDPMFVFDPTSVVHVAELGGMSTGGDVCPPVDGLGQLEMTGAAAGAWYSLSFSVDSHALGAAESSLELARAEEGTGAGRIFSYTSEGSSNIRPNLIDTVRVEFTRDQLGLDPLTNPLSGTRIGALDWGMGLISETPDGGPTAFQPIRDTFYFSLGRDWYETYGLGQGMPWEIWVDRTTGTPILTPGGQTQPTPLDPANVYYMTWDGDNWTQPYLAFTSEELLGEGAEDCAIDGLSVHRAPADGAERPSRVVFSLDSDSLIDDAQPNQILVTQNANSGTGQVGVVAVPLSTPSPAPGVLGTNFTTKAGLLETGNPVTGPDDVKGLCGRDPNETNGLDNRVGYPVEDADGVMEQELSLSMLRYGEVEASGAVTPSMLLGVSGLGSDHYDLGLLYLELELHPSATVQSPVQFKPDDIVGPFVIAAGQSMLELQFPLTVSPGFDLRARVRVDGFLWANFGVTDDIAQSWVTAIEFN